MYDSPRSSTNCGLLFVRRVYAYSARETITLTTAIPSPESNRSEEHTSELQSPCNLVCRLLLEKKKKYQTYSLVLICTEFTTVTNHASPVVYSMTQQQKDTDEFYANNNRYLALHSLELHIHPLS